MKGFDNEKKFLGIYNPGHILQHIKIIKDRSWTNVNGSKN